MRKAATTMHPESIEHRETANQTHQDHTTHQAAVEAEEGCSWTGPARGATIQEGAKEGRKLGLGSAGPQASSWRRKLPKIIEPSKGAAQKENERDFDFFGETQQLLFVISLVEPKDASESLLPESSIWFVVFV